jgi:hypothetical protein
MDNHIIQVKDHQWHYKKKVDINLNRNQKNIVTIKNQRQIKGVGLGQSIGIIKKPNPIKNESK